MKRSYKLMVGLLSAVIILTGCGQKKEVINEHEETQVGQPVEVALVQKDSIETEYMYSGTIKPSSEVKVPVLISGKINSVNIDVGHYVKAGDVLFTIDTEDIENNINSLLASIESADANIKSAQTNLDLVDGSGMQSQIEGAKTSLNNAQLGLENVEINLSKAKLDYENNKELYDLGIISKDMYIQYSNAYDMAKISYEQAQTAYDQALKMHDITVNQMPKENKKRAQDGLEVAQASKKSLIVQLENAKSKLKDAKVTSPISGVVSQSNVKKGEFIAAGSVVPVVVIDNTLVNIEVGLSEQVINKVKLGDSTNVLINSVRPEFIEGKVVSIEPAAGQDNTYGVKIEISNEDGLLKPGMFGEVYFSDEKSNDTVIIPRSAVLEDINGHYVFIEESGLAKKVSVELGIEKEDKVQILSGLSENMNLIVLGQNYVEDGEKLIITSNGKGNN